MRRTTTETASKVDVSVRSIIVPKLVVSKFKLACAENGNGLRYANKSKILLVDCDSRPLKVDTLEKLRDVLVYFRAAAQVCLYLVQKHLKIDNIVTSRKDEIESRPHVIGASSKKANPHMGRTLKDLLDETQPRNEPTTTKTNNARTRDGVRIKNEFYRHLILKTRKKSRWKKSYRPLVVLFSNQNSVLSQ